MKKTPDHGGGAFVRGPSVTPGDALIAWLEQQTSGGEPKLVRLPVVLAHDGFAYTTVGAKIGAGEGAVTIYANDAALGIGLAQQARTQCKDAATCAWWLVGYWRGQQDGDYTFDVMKIDAPISPDALADASHAEVEGDSGN